MSTSSTLPYICNAQDMVKITSRTDKEKGTYYFIMKIGQKNFYAYREVVMNRAEDGFFVMTHLPRRLYDAWIASGDVTKEFKV